MKNYKHVKQKEQKKKTEAEERSRKDNDGKVDRTKLCLMRGEVCVQSVCVCVFVCDRVCVSVAGRVCVCSCVMLSPASWKS